MSEKTKYKYIHIPDLDSYCDDYIAIRYFTEKIDRDKQFGAKFMLIISFQNAKYEEDMYAYFRELEVYTDNRLEEEI